MPGAVVETMIDWPVARVRSITRDWPGFSVELTRARHDRAAEFSRVHGWLTLFVNLAPKPLHMQSRIEGAVARHTPMPPLSWTLVPARQKLRGVIGVMPSFEYMIVTFDPDYPCKVLSGVDTGMDAAGLEFNPLLGHTDQDVAATARKLRSAIAMGEGLGTLYGDALGCALTLELVSRYSTLAPPEPPARGGLSPRVLQAVLEYLRDNLSGDITLADLTALSGLSRTGFYRAFRQSVGASPQRHLAELRLARARELLATTDLPVAVIGAMVGYAEARTFSTLFRRWSGMSPRAFRLGAE